MVKVYYNYTMSHPVAQFVSSGCNIQILTPAFGGNKARYVLCGVNQYVSIISMKTGQILKYLTNSNRSAQMVKFIAVQKNRIYAGYDDGMLICYCIIDMLLNYQVEFVMDAHSTPITYISTPSNENLDEQATRIFTGSSNGTIIIYDVLSQQTQKIKSSHKAAITQLNTVSLMTNGTIKQCLVSIGKDGYLKVWDLKNLLCIGIVGMLGQALSMHIDTIRHLVYIGMDSEKINIVRLTGRLDLQQVQGSSLDRKVCELVGTIIRNNYSKSLQMISEYKTLYILNSDKAIEVYQRQSDPEVNKKKKRLASRKKQKDRNQHQKDIQQPQQEDQGQNYYLNDQQVNLYELTLKLATQKPLLQKFHNFAISNSNIYLNNGTNVYCCKMEELSNMGGSTITKLTHSAGKTFQLQMQYPFVVVRSQKECSIYPSAIVESEGSQLFKSASSKGKCDKLFTIEQEHQIKWCKLFNQGYLMIVTQKSVIIYDLAKNQQVYILEQHWQGCWVKGNNCLLWRDNVIGKFQIGYNKQKQIQIRLVSQHKFPQKITQASALNLSFNKYLLNLQNNTILMNYSDTHKHFLTFHGHKLPILTFSIASDDTIMVTGSVDKDIRLWDLQFGHCIKTLFAHKAPVTTVEFVKDTHYLWSGGRDGLIKMWDMDTYELIIELDQVLNGEVKDIKVSSNGQHLIAGGVDGGMRIWQKSEDQIVAGDQEEKNREKIMIEDYAMDKIKNFGVQRAQKDNQQEQDPQNMHYTDDNPEKIRYDDLKHGQQLIEALENAQHPSKLIELLKKIAPSNLKSSLSFLHRSHTQKLEKYLKFLVQKNYQVELCYRVIEGMSHNTIYNALGGLHTQGMSMKMNSIGDSEQKRQQTLGKILRKRWEDEMKMLRVNRELFRLLGRSLKEEKEFV